MNDFTKEELNEGRNAGCACCCMGLKMIISEKITRHDCVLGSVSIPEEYLELKCRPFTKEEKNLMRIEKIKDIAKECAWVLLGAIGLCLQIGGLAYMAGEFFRMGSL